MSDPTSSPITRRRLLAGQRRMMNKLHVRVAVSAAVGADSSVSTLKFAFAASSADAALQTSSRAASIWIAMSASLKETPCFAISGLPNACRSFA